LKELDRLFINLFYPKLLESIKNFIVLILSLVKGVTLDQPYVPLPVSKTFNLIATYQSTCFYIAISSHIERTTTNSTTCGSMEGLDADNATWEDHLALQ